MINLNDTFNVANFGEISPKDITEEIAHKLPPPPNADLKRFDVYQNYEIGAEMRNALKDHLSEKGIGTLIQWGGKALSDFPMLKATQPLKRTQEFFKKCIMLPINNFVTNSDVEYVCEMIINFYGSRQINE